MVTADSEDSLTIVLLPNALFSKTMITLELKSYVVLLLLYMPIS